MDANSLILLFGTIAGLVVYWKKGGNQAATETLAMYKARDEVQDKENKRKDEQISKLTHEVGKLTGIIESQKDRILTLESVDISRNPVMLQFMEKLNKSADESALFMLTFKDMPQIMTELKTAMVAMNEHMAKAA